MESSFRSLPRVGPSTSGDVFQSQKFELGKFVFALRVSLCLFILVVDVISRLLIWFARDVVVQMRGFFHACQEFCWQLASWLQFGAFCFACCVLGKCCFFSRLYLSSTGLLERLLRILIIDCSHENSLL